MLDVGRSKNLPSGTLTFPRAVHLWASIVRPGEPMTMGLFEACAGALVVEVQSGRLSAFLQAGTVRLKADFPLHGEVLRKIMSGGIVELAPPHVTAPATGVVVFSENDVLEAAERGRIFSALRVPIGEAMVWVATRDPEAVRAYRVRPGAAFARCFGEDGGSALLWAEARRIEGGDVIDPQPLETLLAAIEAGRLQVFGRERGARMRGERPIPATQWGGAGGLQICSGSTGFYATADRLGDPEFEDLGVCRTSLMLAFPALGAPSVSVDDPLPAQTKPEPASLVDEVATIAPGLGITAAMRLQEKTVLVESWYRERKRQPPGATTIRVGLKRAGLTNQRKRRG